MLSSQRQCRCCGATFAQLLSLSCDRPDICPDDLLVQDNSALNAEKGDILTEDFCRLGELRFIRAVLAIPLTDARGEEFILGTWARLEQSDFDAFLERFEMGDAEELGSQRAELANAIPPEGAPAVAAMLHMRPEGQYPDLQISDPQNPLYNLQMIGANLEELLSLLFAYGHDLPSLVYDS
ncbi:DUF2199 domain-containing protein [Phaeobacter sp.]|uniref:DUF2199 domain-containing protein n=1 Tax=Phaeobacter sp. TaxID=1902409 RepID=UPI0025EF754B|nr:DUF2199 domain-containing protein [Phaeobacter sp.]